MALFLGFDTESERECRVHLSLSPPPSPLPLTLSFFIDVVILKLLSLITEKARFRLKCSYPGASLDKICTKQLHPLEIRQYIEFSQIWTWLWAKIVISIAIDERELHFRPLVALLLSYVWLCNPVDCITSGFTVLH